MDNHDLLKEICRCVDHHDCPHPGFVGCMCTRCGLPPPECGDPLTLPFNYIRPELTLTLWEITRLRDINLRSLIRCKKLHLVLDLDNTLLHAIPSYTLTLEEKTHLASNPSVYEVCGGAVVVKLRPGVREFLEEASGMFEMSVYTTGTRRYAEEVARVLDPRGRRFGWRVMCREDCLIMNTKSLDSVLSQERVVLIVDDQVKAWGSRHKGNIVKIKPYNSEDEEDKEMSRVLNTLRKVYDVFYSYGFEKEFGDVRSLLQNVDFDFDVDDGSSSSTCQIHHDEDQTNKDDDVLQIPFLKKLWRKLLKFQTNSQQISTKNDLAFNAFFL